MKSVKDKTGEKKQWRMEEKSNENRHQSTGRMKEMMVKEDEWMGMEGRLAAGCWLFAAVCCLSGGVGPPDWAWQDGERGAGQRLSHGAKYGSRFIARHRECRSQNIVAIYV